MTASPNPYQLFVGVGSAATTFAARWMTATSPRQRALTFAQTPDGFSAFQERVCALGVPPGATLIVIEATLSDWVALA